MQKKPYQALSWIGTAVLVGAAALAAFNLYPYYIYAFLLGNLWWTMIGYLWQENSLIALNVGLSGIYILGLIL